MQIWLVGYTTATEKNNLRQYNFPSLRKFLMCMKKFVKIMKASKGHFSKGFVDRMFPTPDDDKHTIKNGMHASCSLVQI